MCIQGKAYIINLAYSAELSQWAREHTFKFKLRYLYYTPTKMRLLLHIGGLLKITVGYNMHVAFFMMIIILITITHIEISLASLVWPAPIFTKVAILAVECLRPFWLCHWLLKYSFTPTTTHLISVNSNLLTLFLWFPSVTKVFPPLMFHWWVCCFLNWLSFLRLLFLIHLPLTSFFRIICFCES